MAELTPRQAAERAAAVELDKLCALMWEAMRAADPAVHLPAYADLEFYGDDIELPGGPGTYMLITAAARAVRADRDRLAAELAREKRERLQYAGERDAARSELSRLLRFFRLASGTWTARVPADVLARLAVNGGVKVPDGIPQQPSDASIMAHHGRACTAVGEVRAAIAMLNGQAASEAEAIDLIESSIARFDKDGGR